MPLYPVQKAIGSQQALLDEYLPNAERNVFGGKVTLRDMLDFVRGKTAEEQVAGFAGPAINPALMGTVPAMAKLKFNKVYSSGGGAYKTNVHGLGFTIERQPSTKTWLIYSENGKIAERFSKFKDIKGYLESLQNDFKKEELVGFD